MSEPSEFDAASLPAWARESLAAVFEETAEAAAPSVLDYRKAAAWPLLLEAAVVGTFLPKELAPDAVKGEERPAAEGVTLGFAEMTYGPAGVRWALTQEARAAVIEAAQVAGELSAAIGRTAERFADPVSTSLRECLKRVRTIDKSRSVPADLNLEASPANLQWLEATRAAVALLSGVASTKAGLPQLEELDRMIEFRRLLAQFERMVEQRPDEAPSGRKRYFFGREAEIEDLRAYVGVIGAESWWRVGTRAANAVVRAVRGRGAKTVWGVGGVGKTTLISKFMLDHARAASSRFPFAYLDFDRATVSARRRAALLAEMCLQTATQFKELSKPLGELRATVSRLTLKLEASKEFESVALLKPHALRFRQIVDDYISSLEGTFEGQRPFLLVFDTFEVVQYTQEDVEALEEFVRAFSHEDESGMWPRLRLIISGRKKVTNFLGAAEELPLGALDPKGSAELLMAFAGDAGRPINRADADKLVAAVAKATREKNKGVQPLRLQLIGEVFKDKKTKGDGTFIAQTLTQEMKQPLKAGGLAAEVLIDGILIRRVLGHVNDPRVKALADPGLVVRRITVDVIREVMARGTSHPSAGEPPDADTEPTVPWEVDEAEALSIFEAFKREVSLVEPDRDVAGAKDTDGKASGAGAPEREALRHRPDLRKQMLPLIQALRPQRFEALNRLAFDYFRRRAESDVKDLASAAEAVYHGLWLDKPFELLNQLWRNTPAFDPRIDLEEFDRRGRASVFLRAKARGVLTPGEVSQLPPELALEWLDARGAALLNNRQVEGAIQAIRAAAGDDYSALDERPETAAVLARLLFRAGLWEDVEQLAVRHLKRWSLDLLASPDKRQEREQPKATARREALLSLFRTRATVIAKGEGPPGDVEWLVGIAPYGHDPVARLDIAAHAAVSVAKLEGVPRGRGLLEPVIEDSIREVRPGGLKSNQRMLRMAILTSGDHAPELLEEWIQSNDWVPREADGAVLSELLAYILRVSSGGRAAAELKDLTILLHSGSKAAAMDKLDGLWQEEKQGLQNLVRGREARRMFRLLVASEHSDWIRPLGNALTRALKHEGGAVLADWLGRRQFLGGRDTLKRQLDGVSIVQAAADSGRLLELAEVISYQPDAPSSQKDYLSDAPRQAAYPQDVFGISRALLRWHKVLVDSFCGDTQ
jgi:hypothetical protein